MSLFFVYFFEKFSLDLQLLYSWFVASDDWWILFDSAFKSSQIHLLTWLLIFKSLIRWCIAKPWYLLIFELRVHRWMHMSVIMVNIILIVDKVMHIIWVILWSQSYEWNLCFDSSWLLFCRILCNFWNIFVEASGVLQVLLIFVLRNGLIKSFFSVLVPCIQLFRSNYLSYASSRLWIFITCVREFYFTSIFFSYLLPNICSSKI